MKSRSFRRLLPGLLLVALAGAVAAQTPPPAPPSPFVPGPWWRDLRETLKLTDEQSRRIDEVFRSTMTAVLRPGRNELDALEAELSRMITADADEGAIAKQIDRVEALRAMLNKNRTLMLVRMRVVLTPEQRTKLSMLRERWEQENQPPRQGSDRGRSGSDRDRRPPNQRQDAPRTPR